MTENSTKPPKPPTRAFIRLPRSRAKRIALALLLAGLALPAALVGATLWITLATEDAVYRDIESLPNHEVGLLLGTSKSTVDGYLSLHFQNRIRAAAELYKRGKIKHILASGANPSRHYNEPLDMRNALMKRGVPETAITMDIAGLRTLDSVVRAKRIYGLDQFTIISQEYHNYRAVFIAEHYGMDVAAFCADSVDFRNSVRTENREYFARVKAILDLYILGTQPQVLGEQKTILIQTPPPPVSPKVIPPDDLGALLEEIRQKHDMPALAAAVLFKGRLAGLGVAGIRKKGEDTPAEIGDLFHIGSCTKAMTATLVGQLVESGKLRWDLTLAEVFPDLADEMHPSYRKVTIKHLLSHRAGLPRTLPEGKTLMDLRRLPGSARERCLTFTQLMLSAPPEYEPGSKYLYSNAGYAIVGAIIEETVDATWEEYIKEHLFRPLGMDSAGFGAMGEPGPILQPWQHRMAPSGKIIPVEPGPMSDNPPVLSSAGRVHCSAEDLSKFLALHLRGARGQSTFLKPETIKVLHTPPFGGTYALGWATTERPWGGGQVLTHTGTNTMNYAVVWLAPLKDFAVLALTNQGGDKAFKACDATASALIHKYLKK